MPKPQLQQQKLTFRSGSIVRSDSEAFSDKHRSVSSQHPRSEDTRHALPKLFAKQKELDNGEVPLAVPLYPSDVPIETAVPTPLKDKPASQNKDSPLNLGVVKTSLDLEFRSGTRSSAPDLKDVHESGDLCDSQALPIRGIRFTALSQSQDDLSTPHAPSSFAGVLHSLSGNDTPRVPEGAGSLQRLESISGNGGQRKLNRFFNVIPATNQNPFLPSRSRGKSRVGVRGGAGFAKAVVPPKHGEISQYMKAFHQIAQIGSGSFCNVFRARSRMDGCTYAVKCRKTALTESRTEVGEDGTLQNISAKRAMEMREVHALAALTSCPYIIRYYSAWTDDDLLWIQTELAWGSLEDAVVGRRPGPDAERVRVNVFQPQFNKPGSADTNVATAEAQQSIHSDPSPRAPPPSVRRPLTRSRILHDDTPADRPRMLAFSSQQFEETSGTVDVPKSFWSPDPHGISAISLQADVLDSLPPPDASRKLERLPSNLPPSVGASQLSQQASVAGQKRKARQLPLPFSFHPQNAQLTEIDSERFPPRNKVLASPTFVPQPQLLDRDADFGPSPRRRRVSQSHRFTAEMTDILRGDDSSSSAVRARSRSGVGGGDLFEFGRYEDSGSSAVRMRSYSGNAGGSQGEDILGSQTGFGEEGFSQMSVFSAVPHGMGGGRGLAVDDPSIRDATNRYHFLEIDVLTVLKHIATALQYMHARGLAHLDIKPANILVTYEGGPSMCDVSGNWLAEITAVGGIPSIDLKIFRQLQAAEAASTKLCLKDVLQLVDGTAADLGGGDFACPVEVRKLESLGLVRYKLGDLGQVAPLNSKDVTEGDSRYLSKELLEGDECDLAACDIFSLGLTLFELASGKPLPTGDSEWHELRMGILPPDSMPQISEDVQSIIKSMIHADPMQRPTAAQLLSLPLVALLENSEAVLIDTDGHVSVTQPANTVRSSAAEAPAVSPTGSLLSEGFTITPEKTADWLQRFPTIAALLGGSTSATPPDNRAMRLDELAAGQPSFSDAANCSAVFDDSFSILKTPPPQPNTHGEAATALGKTAVFEGARSVQDSVVTPLNEKRMSISGISLQPYTKSTGADSKGSTPAYKLSHPAGNLLVDPEKLKGELQAMIALLSR